MPAVPSTSRPPFVAMSMSASSGAWSNLAMRTLPWSRSTFAPRRRVVLRRCQSAGLCSKLALRGSPPRGDTRVQQDGKPKSASGWVVWSSSEVAAIAVSAASFEIPMPPCTASLRGSITRCCNCSGSTVIFNSFTSCIKGWSIFDRFMSAAATLSLLWAARYLSRAEASASSVAVPASSTARRYSPVFKSERASHEPGIGRSPLISCQRHAPFKLSVGQRTADIRPWFRVAKRHP